MKHDGSIYLTWKMNSSVMGYDTSVEVLLLASIHRIVRSDSNVYTIQLRGYGYGHHIQTIPKFHDISIQHDYTFTSSCAGDMVMIS